MAFRNAARKGRPVEFDAERMQGAMRSSDRICVKLPGKRCRHVEVRADELISSLKRKMAEKLGVKEKNWGIYAAQDGTI